MPRIPPPIMALLVIQLRHLFKDKEKDLSIKVALALLLIENGPELIEKLSTSLVEGDEIDVKTGKKDVSEKKPLGVRIREALENASNHAKVFLIENTVVFLAKTIDDGNELAYTMVDDGFQKIKVENPKNPPPNDTEDTNEYWFRDSDRLIKDVESVKFFKTRIKSSIQRVREENGSKHESDLEKAENRKKEREAILKAEYDSYVRDFNDKKINLTTRYNLVKDSYDSNKSEYNNIKSELDAMADGIKASNDKLKVLSETMFLESKKPLIKDYIEALNSLVNDIPRKAHIDKELVNEEVAKLIYNNGYVNQSYLNYFFSMRLKYISSDLLLRDSNKQKIIESDTENPFSSSDVSDYFMYGSTLEYAFIMKNDIPNLMTNLSIDLSGVNGMDMALSYMKDHSTEVINFYTKISEYVKEITQKKLDRLIKLSHDIAIVDIYNKEVPMTFEKFSEGKPVDQEADIQSGVELYVDENTFKYNGPIDNDDAVSLYCNFMLVECNMLEWLYQVYAFVRRLIIKIRIFINELIKALVLLVRGKNTAIQVGENSAEYVSGTFQTVASVGVGSSVSVITV